MYVNDVEVPLPLYVKLRNELLLQGRSYRWLANNLYFTYNHTYKMLNGLVDITKETQQNINELLGTNF